MTQLLKTLTFCFAFFSFYYSVARQDNDSTGEFHLDETYQVNSQGTLYMNPSDADVEIIGSDRSDIHVKIDRSESVKGNSYSNKNFSIKVYEKNGNLYLDENDGISFTVNINNSYKLDYKILIEMPNSISIDAKSDDSNYNVSNVDGEIQIKLDDGDINLEKCNGSKFNFSLDDGDLTLDGGNGELYAKLDDGDVSITDGNFTEMELSNDDGQMYLETSLANNGVYSLKGDDARIELVVISGGGNFTIDMDDTNVKTSSAFQTIKKRETRAIYSLPNGEATVKIRTDDGQVRLSTRPDKS